MFFFDPLNCLEVLVYRNQTMTDLKRKTDFDIKKVSLYNSIEN